MRTCLFSTCCLVLAAVFCQPGLTYAQQPSTVRLYRIDDLIDAGSAVHPWAAAFDPNELPSLVTCFPPEPSFVFGVNGTSNTFQCEARVGAAEAEIEGITSAQIIFPRPGATDYSINANSIFGFFARVKGDCPALEFDEIFNVPDDNPDPPTAQCTWGTTGVYLESLTEFYTEVRRPIDSTDEEPECSDDGQYTMTGHFHVVVSPGMLSAYSTPSNDPDDPEIFIIASAMCGESWVEVQWNVSNQAFELHYLAWDETEATICEMTKQVVVTDPLSRAAIKIPFQQVVQTGEVIFSSTAVGLGPCLMTNDFEPVSPPDVVCVQEYVNYTLSTPPTKTDEVDASITVFAEVKNLVVEGDLNGDGAVSMADTTAELIAGFFDGVFAPEYDINNDCAVDAADYAAFKDHLVDCGLLVIGDVNGDGVLNLLDVEPFIDKVNAGEYCIAADINCDGAVNLLDVDPFVNLL